MVANNDFSVSELNDWIVGIPFAENRKTGKGGDHRFGLGCTEFELCFSHLSRDINMQCIS